MIAQEKIKPAFSPVSLNRSNKDADVILFLKLMHRRFGCAQKQAYPLTRDILDKLFKEKWSSALGPTAKF